MTSTQTQILLPAPLPHQLPVLLSPARFKLVAAGRRWGKTSVGLTLTLSGHGPRRQFIGAAQGGRIWWVAPSYPIANEIIWPDLKRACAGAWIEKSEAEHSIRLPGGGSISVKSADNPDSLRGAGLDGIVMDEAAFTKKNVWHEVLRPALSDRQGWANFISTPNGMNWFCDLFQLAGREPGWERWQRPTSDNPCISSAELEAARNEIGSRAFAQEYEAQFVSIAGAEFPPEWFEDIWADEWPTEFEYRYGACDPSKGKHQDRGDYSALVFVGKGKNDGRHYVDASIARRDPATLAKDCVSWSRRYGPFDSILLESNGFQEVILELIRIEEMRSGLPPQRWRPGISSGEKAARIAGTLATWLENGHLRFRRTLDMELLLGQLRDFPFGAHDDGPDALEMALREALHVEVAKRQHDVIPQTIYGG